MARNVSGHIRVSSPLSGTKLQRRLLKLLNDKEVNREVHRLLGERCNIYVPKKSGALRQSMKAYPQSVRWETPYARYQYEGEVYGPNWVGYTSPSTWEWRTSKNKHKMGRTLGENPGERLLKPKFGKQYNTEPISVRFGYTEPNTSHHWLDEAMKNGGLRAYSISVTAMLKRKAKELDI